MQPTYYNQASMKLAIFDLDGTLSPQRPYSTAPFQRILLPAVSAKLSVLKQQGVFLAVATNQGGAGRQRVKRLSMGAVQSHLHWLRHELGLHTVRFATSAVRKKPNPVMLMELMSQFSAAPHETLFVGDAETDQQAAAAAGIPFVYAEKFFDYGEEYDVYRQRQHATGAADRPGGSTPLAPLPGYVSWAGTTHHR